MKKIKLFFSIILTSLVLGISFMQFVYAEEDTTFAVTINFVIDKDNGGPLIVDNLNVGDKISVTGLNEEKYNFKFWIVNGVLRLDLEASAQFLASENLILTMVYEENEPEKFPVIFMDTNGHLIGDVIFSNGSVLIPSFDVNDYSKPGYELLLDDETPVFRKLVGSDLSQIEEASVYVLEYQLKDGVLPVTINQNNYAYNEVVTFNSIEEDFRAWVDSEGRVLSYDSTYKFSALIDLDGIIESTNSNLVEAPLVTFLDVTGIRDDKYSYLGQYHLPEGYDFIEAGFEFNDLLVPSYSFNPNTNEFLRSTNNDYDNVRAYLTYKHGDEVTTIFSENEKKPVYTVTFNSNDGSLVDLVLVNEGDKLVAPTAPTKDGFTFEGWFKDSEFNNIWLFDEDVVSNDLTLYAKWEEIVLPKLPTPVNGVNIDEATNHLGIGVYAGGDGYDDKLELLFVNNTTNEKFAKVINAPAGQGYSYFYTELNLTPGSYKLSIKAIAKTSPRTHQDSDYMQAGNFNVPKPQLSSLSLSINTELKQLSWTPVPNATSYAVYLDNELQESNATSPYDLSEITTPGTYTLKVVASADNYQSSEKAIQYILIDESAKPLDKPTNIELDSFNLKWNEVLNAVGYEVRIGNIIKHAETNEFDISEFELSGEQTVYVKALGNKLDYADSEEAEVLINIPVLLPRLNSLTEGNFVSTYILNGVDGGHRKLEIYDGHAVYQQKGYTGMIRLGIKVDGVMIYKDFDFNSVNMQFIHTPNDTNSFFGKNLPSSGSVELHFILVGDGKTARDSAPLITTMNWSIS